MGMPELDDDVEIYLVQSAGWHVHTTSSFSVRNKVCLLHTHTPIDTRVSSVCDFQPTTTTKTRYFSSSVGERESDSENLMRYPQQTTTTS
jgi:hypothetical protein